MGQVLKVDREDGVVVHVDDCGPTGRVKSVWMAKMVGRLAVKEHTQASREKLRGADPELSLGLEKHRTRWS